jgi:hypothetical protein
MSNSSTSSSPASSSPATTSPTNTFNNVYSQAPAESASVAVKFIEDPETKAVTVFVIDRASNKVVRTIPQNEMNNMRPGSLLEITA